MFGNYANTQLTQHTRIRNRDLRLDRSSEGEFSGICPPRGCGGVGCDADGDDYSVIEGAGSRCYDTTDAADKQSADPTKPTGKHPSPPTTILPKSGRCSIWVR